MSIFVDTSALIALVSPNDEKHDEATAAFAALDDGELLLTSNYVVVETVALVQRRLGLETVRALRHGLLPALDVRWVDPPAHEAALDELEAKGHRRVSLVDYTSFTLMRGEGVLAAFAFDEDFLHAGFRVVPAPAHTGTQGVQ